MDNTSDINEIKDKIANIERSLAPNTVSISLGQIGIVSNDLLTAETTLYRILKNPRVYKYLVTAERNKKISEGNYLG